jgi:hypothetical protein
MTTFTPPPFSPEPSAENEGAGGPLNEYNPAACPDGGTCHHGCIAVCFRVRHASPLSGVFPDDTWPAEVMRLWGKPS